MSAYIVDDETINRTIGAIEYAMQHRRDCDHPRAPEGIGLPTCEPAELRTLGGAMRAMNERAIRAHYGTDAASMIGDAYVWESRGFCGSWLQVIKSLACYLYQCSEGTVPAEPLYKALAAWRDELCRFVVDQLPAYDQAAWA